MAHPRYLVRRRDGLYFFRHSVPLDLRPGLQNRKELRLSLHTYDLSQARTLAALLKPELDRLFRNIRRGLILTKKVRGHLGPL